MPNIYAFNPQQRRVKYVYAYDSVGNRQRVTSAYAYDLDGNRQKIYPQLVQYSLGMAQSVNSCVVSDFNLLGLMLYPKKLARSRFNLTVGETGGYTEYGFRSGLFGSISANIIADGVITGLWHTGLSSPTPFRTFMQISSLAESPGSGSILPMWRNTTFPSPQMFYPPYGLESYTFVGGVATWRWNHGETSELYPSGSVHQVSIVQLAPWNWDV